MRTAFIDTLFKEASKNDSIMLLTADLGYTLFEKFKKSFPDRFINIGVAEQNMMGIATGLALTGKIVFAYSIASFVTMRAFEHIRNDIALHKASVVIVGSGGGLPYAAAGVTHHAIEDISLMRSIPHMTVLCPADSMEAIWATETAISLKSPVYIRLGKTGELLVHKKNSTFKLGKGKILEKGNDAVIISCGNIVKNALQARVLLLKKKITAGVVSMHTIKPIDTDLIKDLANKIPHMVTIEEHSIIGGLGSAVAEVLSEQGARIRLLRIGIEDNFIEDIGSHDYLRKKIGLDPGSIADKIIRKLRND